MASKLDDFRESTVNAKGAITKKVDDVSTSIYKKFKNLKLSNVESDIVQRQSDKLVQKRKESDNLLDEMASEANLENVDMETYNTFYEIDEEEYSDISGDKTNMVSVEITNWLLDKKEIDDIDSSEKNKGKTNKQKKDIEFSKKRIEQGEKFKEMFKSENSVFRELSKELKKVNKKNTTASRGRFLIIQDVLDAFSGDQESIDNIAASPDEEFARRIKDIVLNNIEGKSDNDDACKRLFLETYGIDNTKIQLKNKSILTLSYLATMQEANIDAVKFAEINTNQMDLLINKICGDRNFNDPLFISKFLIYEMIENAIKEGGLQAFDMNGINNEVAIILEKDDTGLNIYRQQCYNEQKIATINEAGEFEHGGINDVVEIYQKSKEVRDFVNGRDKDELTLKLEALQKEADADSRNNPATKEEIEAYRRESEAAMEARLNGKRPTE